MTTSAMSNRAIACSVLLAFLTSCDGSDSPSTVPPELPALSFRLLANAEATADSITVTCALDYVVDIAGEVSRTDTVVEYVGTMGGEANRKMLNPDQSGVSFVADAFSEIQVLVFVPDGVEINLINVPPDPPGTRSRFWEEQRHFEGRLIGDTIQGAWTCAPLDTEIGGIADDTVFAEGTWISGAVNGQ